MADNVTTVAVVSGAHPYDVMSFQAAFRAMPGIDFYPQHLEDFLTDKGRGHRSYDAAVFYNFHQLDQVHLLPWWERGRETLERLGETKQGIVVLHHAIAAFRQWSPWSAICGMENRTFDWFPEQTLRVDIARADHPITESLSSWEMVEETYVIPDPGAGNQVLLVTDHPRSGRTLAWVRQHGEARVFFLQLGHDSRAYDGASFRTVLGQGIQWVAGKL